MWMICTVCGQVYSDAPHSSAFRECPDLHKAGVPTVQAAAVLTAASRLNSILHPESPTRVTEVWEITQAVDAVCSAVAAMEGKADG